MAGLYTLIADRLEMAVDAFLLGERAAAATLVASDPDVDRREREVELQVQHELARRAELSDPAFAHLVLVLLIAPELERSADLVEHIALRTGQGGSSTCARPWAAASWPPGCCGAAAPDPTWCCASSARACTRRGRPARARAADLFPRRPELR